MPEVSDAARKRLINQIKRKVADKAPKTQRTDLTAFAEQYLANVPPEDLAGVPTEHLFAAVMRSWKLIQHHAPASLLVDVFNPDKEKNGWNAPYTVVEVLSMDMPFLVESVRMELNRREVTMHRLQEVVLKVERDKRHRMTGLHAADAVGFHHQREILLHIVINRQPSEAALEALKDELRAVIRDVCLVNEDFGAMRRKCDEILSDLHTSPPPLPPDHVREVAEFLTWLADGQFTFLGFDELRLSGKAGHKVMEPVHESALGIRRERIKERKKLPLSRLAPDVQAFLQAPKLITVSKSSTRSRVHRPAYPDYVSIRSFNRRGEVVSEHRFLGLFTVRFYNETLQSIPLVRRKVGEMMTRAGFDPASHAGKAFANILHNYPREELLEASAAELYETVTGIYRMQERRMVRLFMHKDAYNKFVTALVYCPRDLFTTELRLKFQNILRKAVGAIDADFTTHMSESPLVRVHFVLRVDPLVAHDYDCAEVEQRIRAAARSWTEDLQAAILEQFGEDEGHDLHAQYKDAFPESYKEDFSPQAAAHDIATIREMDQQGNLGTQFYRGQGEDGNLLRFKLIQKNQPLPLSDVLPILENLGMCVLAENPHDLRLRDGTVIWVRDFRLQFRLAQDLDIDATEEIFLEAFAQVWNGNAENDGFNRLVLGGGFNWREVAMFRAYSAYNKQIRFTLSQAYTAETLGRHNGIARQLLAYFRVLFDPAGQRSKEQRDSEAKKLSDEILVALDAVSSLDEDRILRRYLELMNATLRTNFYQPRADGSPKDYIALKINPRAIVEIPKPRPMFEIFVSSPRVDGVHLRGGKVARGGLRWSDRLEDFRTEVLGLVKAQQVKNAVIVPVGAKGGFVVKRPPAEGGREAYIEEGINCYQTFIRALLDVTDNFVAGKVVPPKNVVRRDEDDYYLVVAADKGTATFSDIANGISAEYGHWLGDAFASGGSVGYDHKGMGITARGAWVSVQRHFRELGINTQEDEFTVVGVGDMSGDVFGNGMLLSQTLRLVAAFNHLHIFIDPDPDAAASFKERQRLFRLPRSSWADYNVKLISKGGGVFERSAKSIAISPQMKARFGIEADKLTPNELMRALLKSRVDLFWNGGIGTYVRGSGETDLDVGDKANDAIRITGRELRAKVVGEGGNLGMTQLGRIEYGLNGGLCNTDFIDNAGGVDCSDHEVNIKILLNSVIENRGMTGKQRNALLAEMTDTVADLVLQNNYRQTQALSIALSEVKTRMEEYRRYINAMEAAGKLDRALEFLPDEETFSERVSREIGLSRAELCVLISYCKADLKEQLIHSTVPDDAYLRRELETCFPPVLRERYQEELYNHQLRREIAATQIANDLVNHMGITYIQRLSESTGTKPSHVARAYLVARDIFDVDRLWRKVEALDYTVTSAIQMEMTGQLIRLTRRASRWLLRNCGHNFPAEATVGRYRDSIREIAGFLPEVLMGVHQETLESKTDYLRNHGVPDDIAHEIASLAVLYNGLGIIEASAETGTSLRETAQAFFMLGSRLQLHWFSRQITDIPVGSHWQAMARETFRDDLDNERRRLVVSMLRMEKAPAALDARIEAWVRLNRPLVERWLNVLNGLRNTSVHDFAMFSVACRELLDLSSNAAAGGIAQVEKPRAGRTAPKKKAARSASTGNGRKKTAGKPAAGADGKPVKARKGASGKTGRRTAKRSAAAAGKTAG